MKNKKIRGPSALEVTIFVPSHIVTITQRDAFEGSEQDTGYLVVLDSNSDRLSRFSFRTTAHRSFRSAL